MDMRKAIDLLNEEVKFGRHTLTATRAGNDGFKISLRSRHTDERRAEVMDQLRQALRNDPNVALLKQRVAELKATDDRDEKIFLVSQIRALVNEMAITHNIDLDHIDAWDAVDLGSGFK